MGPTLLLHLSLLMISAGPTDIEHALRQLHHDPACFSIAEVDRSQGYRLTPRASCPDADPLWVVTGMFGPRVFWVKSETPSPHQIEVLNEAARLYEPRFREKLQFFIDAWSSAEAADPAARHNSEVFARAYSAYLHRPALSRLWWDVQEHDDHFCVSMSVEVPRGELQPDGYFMFHEEQPVHVPRW